MDIGAVSGSSLSTEPSLLDSEEDDRSFIEISELDKLLGLPPPRFGLGGAADIDALTALQSGESSASFDTDLDFTVPHKPCLPQRLRIDLCPQNESETEVCYDKDSSKVSVSIIKSGSDGRADADTNSYLSQSMPVAAASTSASVSAQGGEMLYKRGSPGRRGKHWSRGGGGGGLNHVVTKLLAKSDSPDSILQNLLQPYNSICDNPHTPIPKNTPTIPSPVLNKLKKLGTSVEIEKPEPVPHVGNGNTVDSPPSDKISSGYLQIMESLDKAVGLTSDLTKKKKKKAEKRAGFIIQVPSSLQLLAELESCENLAKFSFQVDAKQVIELAEGQKVYTCDICSGVYHRGFSLKRHYLKTHINYKHISKRDLHNCGILFDPSIEKGGARRKQLMKDSPPVVTNLSPPNDIPDLYRCHSCSMCFMLISDLKTHLMEHPPVSAQNLAQDQFKNYTCPKCKARYQKKKLFLCHKETCGVEPEPVPTHHCLYCEKVFPTFLLKKRHHLQVHHPKKRLHQCYLCKTKMFKERFGVFKHLILHHSDEYIGCLSCKLRFGSREEYKKHQKESHKPLDSAKKLLLHQKNTAPVLTLNDVNNENVPIEIDQAEEITQNNPNLILKCTECPKMFACYLNMTRHRRLAHRTFSKKKRRRMQKKGNIFLHKPTEVRKTPTPPPPLLSTPPAPAAPPPPDPEMLFYSTIAHNIRENLTHHLDGKLDSQEVMEYDLKVAEEPSKVLSFSASFTPEVTTQPRPEASSTPVVQQKESRFTPISPRAPWEKFNFPKNYDGRCGLTSYIKDMSHLDIATQLTMRRNLQSLNSCAGPETSKDSPANIPAGLLLVEKPGPAETFGDPDDSKDKVGSEALELSGEWVRPRTFLCAACGYKSTNLWDTEDHKYALHPNVWVPHIEIVGTDGSEPWDWIYYRRLPPATVVAHTTPPGPPAVPPCSKCDRQSASTADLHRHLLDCGGDTTWMTTMLAVTSPGARRRKWRPFGSRRRKQQGRRLLKRNIPNTPAKHSCGRIRTKPGDMDTIQKMIANLPPKRATRRVLGEENDVKTRTQATISNVPITSGNQHYLGRNGGLKLGKVSKSGPKLQKKMKDSSIAYDDRPRNKDIVIKEEPEDDIKIKEEDFSESYLQPLEAENPVQHSDILTSLQMIPVVRKSPSPVPAPPQVEEPPVEAEEPIETHKIIEAMREAMSISEGPPKIETAPPKINEKKKRLKMEDKHKKNDLSADVKKSESNDKEVIICHGCGMEFDSPSSCQRHKKKCVYWKEDKTNSGNKNKCTHCGAVFPYLMAFLKHNCNRGQLIDEPAMPQLCPEKPVEEVQGNSVEDIPILSPVDMSKDESTSRRLSLLENTINEVSCKSFDISAYFEKKFNTPYCAKGIDSERSKHSVTTDKNTSNDSALAIQNANIETEQPKPHLEEQEVKGASKTICSPKKSLLSNDDKTPDSKSSLLSREITNNFKEVIKRRGRRPKIQLPPKILSRRSKLRKSHNSAGNHFINNGKRSMNKRKRSSNFSMLMKEWEKLQKEGAVAEGKRNRLSSECSFTEAHSRRQVRSLALKIDYNDIESLLEDDIDSQDDAFESNSLRKSRRRIDSIGTIKDIFPELSSGTARKSLSFPEKARSRSLEHSEGMNPKAENNNLDIIQNIKEEPKTEEVCVVKRKPGRPRKNPIVKTEEHIVDKSCQLEKNKLTNKNSVDRGKQSLENTMNESQQSSRDDDVLWETVEEVIYNVSVGSADVFKPNLDQGKPLSKRGRKRKRRRFQQRPSNDPVTSNSNRKGGEMPSENFKGENITVGITSYVSENSHASDKEAGSRKDKNIIVKYPLLNQLKNNSKSKMIKDFKLENTAENHKQKEMKVKQSSISDYFSAPHVKKTHSEPPRLVENSTDGIFTSGTDSHGEQRPVACSEPIDQVVEPSIESCSNKNNKQSYTPIESAGESKVTEKSNLIANEKPCSPLSDSSKEDLALSVIREKVIQKKKKKFKLKKLFKNKRLDVTDNKLTKLVKPKASARDDRHLFIERLNKGRKKVKMGVSRNRWEVSVVEKKNNPVEILYEDDTKITQPMSTSTNEPVKKFFCSPCDMKFESPYHLYEHQMSPDHKSKVTLLAEQEGGLSEESDPVKYCKSIGNIINDLEKRTLNVAKVMSHLKQRDSTESVPESNSLTVEPVGTSPSGKELTRPVDEGFPEWTVPQEWSRSTTPLPPWETNPQSWDVDSIATSSSLGSILDTVNKLLSPEQEGLSSGGGGVGYSWQDLQVAMGASDEEMAMLEQLGEHSLQEDYVYDNSRPIEEAAHTHTLTDLDHQPPSASTSTSTSSSGADTLLPEPRKQEPVSDSEDSKSCRGTVGRPRRLVVDYETREMVCPTCNKHFLGLPALQTHVVWSHCAPVTVSPRLMSGLKKRALDRRLVCFVCKEIVASAGQLEVHVQTQHSKKAEEHEPPAKPILSEAAEKLKTKMSCALGGLVDRALNKLLGTPKPVSDLQTSTSTSHGGHSHSQPSQTQSQADLNTGALQLLGRLCAARKRVGSENMKLSSDILQLLGRLRAVNHKDEVPTNRGYNTALAHEMRVILARGRPGGVTKGALQASVNNNTAVVADIKPTNLLDHLAVCSPDLQQRPYACPICDLRFLIPSTRNRHIARAHGKYGRRYDEEVEGAPEHDSGWKESVEQALEANEDGDMIPVCSDCGLSFKSIQEVMQHRRDDHPRRFSADTQEDNKSAILCDKHAVVESSSELKQSVEPAIKDDVKLLPVSDNAVDSTSTMKRKRGRPPKAINSKAAQKRKLSESDGKCSPTRNCVNELVPSKKEDETDNSLENDLLKANNQMNEDDSDSVGGTSYAESSATSDSRSLEADKLMCSKLNDTGSNQSSEENLADLSKKLDRRKVRITSNLEEEAVRAKAEAALRELNLSRKSKSSSGAKWGVNAIKFTKGRSSGMSSSQVNGSPSKTRFASLDKKWKAPPSTVSELELQPKPEFIDIKPDIYDFNDEYLVPNKKAHQVLKESFPHDVQEESNKLVETVNFNAKGNTKESSHSSKLCSDSS